MTDKKETCVVCGSNLEDSHTDCVQGKKFPTIRDHIQFSFYVVQRLEEYLDGKVTDRDLRQDLLLKANEMLLLKEVMTITTERAILNHVVQENKEDAQVRADEQARSLGFESEDDLYTSDERADAEADEKERASESILNNYRGLGDPED